ncbi:acetate/propionate family kinase [Pseudorhodoferax sp. Leaf265]|uniref:acetate/propionate family kinase n=1 Tax=Pseudorhodoferax sp. Leaf265 TaxID=1736315 RepID=UPI0006F1FA3A|nr:acetate/propionate family kinase [Pseudorhodoferax sp. Leaf265]KQP08832.1 acetate kinase [Pseudorhodoferax sp. Leaf265]
MNAPTSFIVVLNCGSSSIKFGVFDAADPGRTPAWNGKVQGIGGPQPDFGASTVPVRPAALGSTNPYAVALQLIRDEVLRWLDGRPIAAVAHRVVHGGAKYFAPVRVDAQVLADLKALVPLAPLHQPFALEAMKILLREQPRLPQVACFDTAFHHTVPLLEQLLPLPYAAYERGLRRYGFHGLSYAYMAVALAERHGEAARGRTIVAHLGSGASLCAMQELRSQATTMGFSALDGLMMGTRTGALDPGAVLYLMEIEKLTLEQVGRVLYHESGLLGISGISSDPRVLLAREADTPRAALALQLYVRRVVREIGALTAVLGGLDMLVFTAGIGEHSQVLRERICAGLAWLGVVLDLPANAAHAPLISDPASRVRVAVEPTNEEWIAARHAQHVLGG